MTVQVASVSGQSIAIQLRYARQTLTGCRFYVASLDSSLHHDGHRRSRDSVGFAGPRFFPAEASWAKWR